MGMSTSKTLSSSICFGKLVIFNEASLNPRVAGRKETDSLLRKSSEVFTIVSEAAAVSVSNDEILKSQLSFMSSAKLENKTLQPLRLRCKPPEFK